MYQWLWWPWGGGQSRLIWMDMDWIQTYLIGLLDSGQGQLTPSRETGKDGDKFELSLFMKPSWWGRRSWCWGWRSNVLRVKANRSETEGVFCWLFGTPDHNRWLFGTPYISPNDCHSQCDHCFPCFRLRSTHHQMFFIHKLIWTNFDNFDRVTVRFGQLSRCNFYHNTFVKPIVVTWVKEQRFQSLSNQLWWNHQFESSHSLSDSLNHKRRDGVISSQSAIHLLL